MPCWVLNLNSVNQLSVLSSSFGELIYSCTPDSRQNDRFSSATQTRKRQVWPKRLLLTRSTFSKSLLVSFGISLLRITHLIFIVCWRKGQCDYCDCVVRKCYQQSVKFLKTVLRFHGITFLRTVPDKLSKCWERKQLIVFHQRRGHPTVQISVMLIMISGVCCSDSLYKRIVDCLLEMRQNWRRHYCLCTVEQRRRGWLRAHVYARTDILNRTFEVKLSEWLQESDPHASRPLSYWERALCDWWL